MARYSWNSLVQVDVDAVQELVFWKNNARKLNKTGKSFGNLVEIEAIMYSDASATGYGGYVVDKSVQPVFERIDYQANIADESICCFETEISQLSAEFDCLADSYSGTPTLLPEVSGVAKNDAGEYELPEVSSRFILGNSLSMQSNADQRVVGNSMLPEVSGCAYNSARISVLPEVSTHLIRYDSLHSTLKRSAVIETLPEVSGCALKSAGISGLPEVSPDRNKIGRLKRKTSVLSNTDRSVLPKESQSTKDKQSSLISTETVGNKTLISNIVSGSKVQGNWIEQEKTKSSTWRELQAIYRVLCHNKTCLENKTVKALSDNKNVQYIINSGSSNMELHNTALAIY
jgi:hypothetical protein